MLLRICFISILAVGFGDDYNYLDHPCRRECDGEHMVCEYHFRVEIFYSLDLRACFDCPNNLTDCFRPDCIIGGGIKKNVLSVNRLLPGPTIQVCQGDTVKVKVENLLKDGETIVIHWHGQHMRQTPYMDGAPMITQCPILSHNSFLYTFQATEPGTHFWHSHDKAQRGDGVFGPLIVKIPEVLDPHKKQYDFDLDEHQITITDWSYDMKVNVIGKFFHKNGHPAPDGMLINGLGPMDMKDANNKIPFAKFSVQKGLKYRFRVIQAAFFDSPVSISIDNHNLTIISSDGFDVEPQIVSSFVIFTGERFDFILEANQSPDLYWIRFKAHELGEEEKVYQLGILEYEKVDKDLPDSPKPTYEEAFIEGAMVLNPLIGNETNGLLITELNALDRIDRDLGSPWVEPIYIKLGFNYVENPVYFRSPHYDLQNLPLEKTIPTPIMNDIVYEDPSSPVMQNLDDPEVVRELCSEKNFTRKNCTKEYCSCPHVVKLPYNKIVELIVFDDGSRKAHHPMHLHGYGFSVVAWEYLGNKTSKEEIQDLDRRGLIERNYKKPVMKDTVTVPNAGYVVLRFRADNYGIWLFHCHVDPHADDGMRMAFMVGDNRQIKRPPRNFPNCGKFP